MSIFPLIVSLYLSLSRFKLAKGGFSVDFIGTLNYRKLLFGSQQFHLLGKLEPLSPVAWVVRGDRGRWLASGRPSPACAAVRRIAWLIGRLVIAAGMMAVAVLFGSTSSGDGQLGSLGVTLIYVFVGVAVQYLIGPGAGFPLRAEAGRPPLLPGGVLHSHDDHAGGRRLHVPHAHRHRPRARSPRSGSGWAWRLRLGRHRLGGADRRDDRRHLAVDPVHVHRAAGGPGGAAAWSQIEAAMVDGATRWQVFRYITCPAILPVSVTLILIRMIEAFKIVDLPNVLTNGGPGIASESLTLHAFMAWRTLDLGGSAAVAYMLLFVVTFFGVSFVNLTRRVTAGLHERHVAAHACIDEPTPLGRVVVLRAAGHLDVRRPVPALLGGRSPRSSCRSTSTTARSTCPFIDFQPALDAWQYIFGTMLGDTLRPYLNTVIVALSSSVHRAGLRHHGGLCPGPPHLPAAASAHLGLSSPAWLLAILAVALGRALAGGRRLRPRLFVLLLLRLRPALQARAGQRRHRLLDGLAAHPAAGDGGGAGLCRVPASGPARHAHAPWSSPMSRSTSRSSSG